MVRHINSVSQFFDLRVERNTVHIAGDLRLECFGRILSALYQLQAKAGYTEIHLDFSNLSSLTHSVIPPFAAHLRWLLRDKKVEIEYTPPRNGILSSRIQKLGLAHYIEHRRHPKPKANSSDASLLQFLDSTERDSAVDKVLNSALRKTDLKRQHLAALEWAVHEITENVLSHSHSNVGGFLICHKLPHHNILEFTVADAGIGIPRSLGIAEDEEALERAIQEGVTRDKSSNQGNGLYGTYQIALASSGIFVLRSANASLFVTIDGLVRVRHEGVPYKGTYVVCQIDCDNPGLIERTLSIAGRSYTPSYDYIERKHETSSGSVRISAKDLCSTFGSRQSGMEARRYLRNVLSGDPDLHVDIDFSSVFVISSSFADEVFGKLFVEMGPIKYMRSISLSNLVPAVEGLIDRAITLRAQTGL